MKTPRPRGYRTTPFWRHQTLKVIQEQSHVDESGAEAVDIEDDDDVGGMSREEEENEIEELSKHEEKGAHFEEAINANVGLIVEFAQALRYQVQFRDQRMLNALEREGSGFLRLARTCMEKEKKLQFNEGEKQQQRGSNRRRPK